MININTVKDMVKTCMQCGTCTGSCPNAPAMDATPRKLWQMVLSGKTDQIYKTKTFAMCSWCYTCTLRCPRGLPLTRAMTLLKTLAIQSDIPGFRSSARFYKSFVESIRRHGRVRETEFMTLYFLAMKNPLLPVRFSPLGMKLLQKNKLDLRLPSRPGLGNLEAFFLKVREIEERL